MVENASAERIENHQTFRDRLKPCLSKAAMKRMEKAYEWGKAGHRGKFRHGGERFFEHPRSAALILIDEVGIIDEEILEAELMHDLREDTSLFGGFEEGMTNSEWIGDMRETVTPFFGKKVADILEAVTVPLVDGIEIKTKEEAHKKNLENLEKGPTEALIVKMADRISNLRDLYHMPIDNQIAKLTETVEDYMPLFERAKLDYPREAGILISKLGLEISSNALRLFETKGVRVFN